MGQRRDRLNLRLENQKKTRIKNSSRKAKERIRRAERDQRRAKVREAGEK